MKLRTTLLALATWLICAATASAQGLMIPKDASLSPLAVESHRVSVKIGDQGAVTTVEQVFRNATNRPLEATYVFPMPKDAALTEFALWMNGKKVNGEVVDKDKARQVYTDIVRRMQDPGLLEFLGNDLFRASVFPIPANGTQKVLIAYASVTPCESGLCRYAYPLRMPGAKTSRTLKDFTVDARIKSAAPIKSIYSPSHDVTIDRKGEHEAIIGLETAGAALDKDVLLYWTLSDDDIGLSLLTYKEPGEDGYFLLLAAPKAEWSDNELSDKDIVFVVDNSGSMAGEKMESAKAALSYALRNLRENDHFNIVRFSTGVGSFRKELVPATKGNVEAALAFTDKLRPGGGTAIHDALAEALAMKTGAGRPSMIVFLTDGLPTVGLTDEARIAKDALSANNGRFRLFVFGVGDDVNTRLLDALARDGRGHPTYLRPDHEIETELSAFYDRIARPVMSEPRLDIPKVKTEDVYPRPLPDLFAGTQLVVLGRYTGSGASAVTIHGRVRDRDESVVHEADFPDKAMEADFVPKLWATRKVGYLLEQIRLGGENRELVDEVRELGLKFGIITPYTSGLVIENEEMLTRNNGPVPPPMAEPAPDSILGWGRAGGGGAASDGDVAGTKRERAEAAKSVEGFAAVTGAESVDQSRVIQDYKDTKKSVDEIAEIRTVGAKTFVWRDGRYVDTAFTGKEKVLKVRYLSDAYLAMAAANPKIASYWKLGAKLVVVTKEGFAVEVGEAGQDTLDAPTIKTFLP